MKWTLCCSARMLLSLSQPLPHHNNPSMSVSSDCCVMPQLVHHSEAAEEASVLHISCLGAAQDGNSNIPKKSCRELNANITQMAKYLSLVDAIFPVAGNGTSMRRSMSIPLEVSCGMVLAFTQIMLGVVGSLFVVYYQVPLRLCYHSRHKP